MEHIDFETAIAEKVTITNRDVQLATESLLSKNAIDAELLRAQLDQVIEYARELYEENLLLKATQPPQDTVETFSKEEGCENSEQ